MWVQDISHHHATGRQSYNDRCLGVQMVAALCFSVYTPLALYPQAGGASSQRLPSYSSTGWKDLGCPWRLVWDYLQSVFQRLPLTSSPDSSLNTLPTGGITAPMAAQDQASLP